MAMRSMTGYGRGTATIGGVKVDVELSSVNRKQFDVRLNLPRSLAALESVMIEIIHGAVSRGHVTGTVSVAVSDRTRQQGCRVDGRLAAAYVRELRELARGLKIADDLGAAALLRLPEVVQYHYAEEDVSVVRPVAEQALRKALAALVRMRGKEGAALARDLSGRFRQLDGRLRLIARLAPGVAERYRGLLIERLQRAGMPNVKEDEAVMRDLALFADRCDISEEITRLESHLHQAGELSKSTEPVGRTLDFLAQEMFREINTIGSKANDIDIVKHVIHFKTELERVREQVQNVE